MNKEKHISAILLVGIVSICLIPFMNKAFNIDDPLFIWIARQIQSNPLDFFGFNINWNSFSEPVWQFMENPPLSSYYIAFVAKFFGWSEIALHAAFYVFAIAAALGTYYLARELCSTPLTAALASVLTPVFIISATTVMCDMMLIAFWVWAVFLWMRGINEKSVFCIILASLLISVSILTKYIGVGLIPLLLCYSVFKKQGRWAWFLLIPAAVFAGYGWLTHIMYGKILFYNAASYAVSAKKNFLKLIIGVVFVGGCLITVFFYSFFIWNKKTLIIGALVIMAIVFFIPAHVFPEAYPMLNYASLYWFFKIQFCLFALGGTSALAITVLDLWKSKNAESLLFFLWVTGIFIFMSLINWSVNGRTVLLIFPPMGILIMRAIERRNILSKPKGGLLLLAPLIPSLILTMAIAWADYKWAGAQRDEAFLISRNYKGNGSLWYVGQWGFKYYMEEFGGRPVDFTGTSLQSGDIMVIPQNNNFFFPSSSIAELASDANIGERQSAPNVWMTTMSRFVGAGFYSDLTGPLPFIIAPVPEEKYIIAIFFRPVLFMARITREP